MKAINEGNAAERAEQLRAYETFCYRICFYLLGTHEQAEEAALLCLDQTAREESFFRMEPSEREQRIKRNAVSCSLRLKGEQSRRAARHRSTCTETG